MKSRKRKTAEGRELPYQEKKQNAWREGKLQVLGILEEGTIKQRWKKRVPQKNAKLFETNLCSKNLIKRGSQTNGLKDKETDDYSSNLLTSRLQASTFGNTPRPPTFFLVLIPFPALCCLNNFQHLSLTSWTLHKIIFKWSTASSNSEFSFSLTGCRIIYL